jgi:hypothetical protein
LQVGECEGLNAGRLPLLGEKEQVICAARQIEMRISAVDVDVGSYCSRCSVEGIFQMQV